MAKRSVKKLAKRKPRRIKPQSIPSMVAEFRETLKRELGGMYAAYAKLHQQVLAMDKGIGERLLRAYELHHGNALLLTGVETALRSQRDDIDYLLAELKKIRMVATKKKAQAT